LRALAWATCLRLRDRIESSIVPPWFSRLPALVFGYPAMGFCNHVSGKVRNKGIS
jgi:hypothetical protein